MAVERPGIEVAPLLGGCYLYPHYHPAFPAKLKALVPSVERTYEWEAKRWYVSGNYAPAAIMLMRQHWPEMPFPESLLFAVGTISIETLTVYFAQLNRRQSTREWTYEQTRRMFGGKVHQTPPTASPDHAVLFVTPNAPSAVISAAYKALAKLYHPDVTGDGGERMRQLNAAYERIRAR